MRGNTCVLAPPSYAQPLPSGRARYGPRPLSLLPQLPLHVTPASQVSATSDKPLALGHRDPHYKLLGLNQQVDRTATMNPVLICLLVMVTFFFLLCDAARTGLAQGRAISPSP